MAVRTLIFSLILGIVAVGSAQAEGFTACSKSSPDFEDCLKTQVSYGFKFFKDGNKKMAVIPFDPLTFETMDVNQGSGPVAINLNIKNVKFTGLSTADVTSAKTDWKDFFLATDLPELKVDGDYEIKGQILVLPISGKGRMTMIWKNVKATYNMTMTEVKRDGETYLQVKGMEVICIPEKVTFNFENLFNGNKQLGDNMNTFLNQNWQVVVKEIQPALSKALDIGYTAYVNSILSKVPAKDINVD